MVDLSKRVCSRKESWTAARLRWVRVRWGVRWGVLDYWKWECEGLDQSELEFKYSPGTEENSTGLLFVSVLCVRPVTQLLH